MSEFALKVQDQTVDLGEGSALESAVLISLFTDARVTAEELPEGEPSRRGHWGDAFTGAATGSKLWLLSRGKRTPETLRLYEDYGRQALRWLVADGHVTEIILSAEYVGERVQLTITLDGRTIRHAI